MLTSPSVMPQFLATAMHNSGRIVTSDGVDANRLSSSLFSTFWKHPRTTTLHLNSSSSFQTMTHRQSRASSIYSCVQSSTFTSSYTSKFFIEFISFITPFFSASGGNSLSQSSGSESRISWSSSLSSAFTSTSILVPSLPTTSSTPTIEAIHLQAGITPAIMRCTAEILTCFVEGSFAGA